MPRAATKKKAAAPAAKSKVITHTDDGTPIVNATLAQIRKGTGKSSGKLVRIPQGEIDRRVGRGREAAGEKPLDCIRKKTACPLTS